MLPHGAPPIAPTVIIVEPAADLLAQLRRSLAAVARVVGYTDFDSARVALRHDPPALLVTNIRLGEFNGLHLVLLASPPTRSIVYMEPVDTVLLRDAQRVGAFVESTPRLLRSLPSYVGATLRAQDRRDLSRVDRRGAARGGRRGGDEHAPA